MRTSEAVDLINGWLAPTRFKRIALAADDLISLFTLERPEKTVAEDTADLIALTIEVVSSYVSKNNLRPDDLPAFIASTHAAIKGLESSAAPESEVAPAEEYAPAVTARKSLSSRDHIISLIDGKLYKTLKRHLATNGLTPAEYRQRYGLKADYPMVAPSYSETRKALAQKIGLGRKPATAPAPAAKPAKRTAKAKLGISTEPAVGDDQQN